MPDDVMDAFYEKRCPQGPQGSSMATGPVAKIVDQIEEHSRACSVGPCNEHTFYLVYVRKGKGEAQVEVENPSYEITFDRSSGNRLGLKLDIQVSTRSMYIKEVVGGLAAVHNNSDAVQKVRPGDRIVRVNDVEGDAHALMEECKKCMPLRVELHRQTAVPITAGLRVTVKQPFAHLQVGCEGSVTKVDEEGEALMKFNGIGSQWVCKQDFDKFMFEDSERWYLKRYFDFRNLYAALKHKIESDPTSSVIKDLPELPKEERFGFRRQMSSLGLSGFMAARREGLQKYIDEVMSHLKMLEDEALVAAFFGSNPLPAELDQKSQDILNARLNTLIAKHSAAKEEEARQPGLEVRGRGQSMNWD